MPYFRYKAKNPAGEIISEVIEADNQKFVAEYVQNKGYFPVSIAAEKNGVKRQARQKKVKINTLVIFTRQICDLLKGGLPLAKAMELAYKQTENQQFKEIIKDIKEEILKGSSFSSALGKYPHVFNPLYVGMVKAGESSGMLEVSMERIAQHQEKEQDLINKIKTAMAYPAAMMIIGGCTVAFLLVVVIPRFSVIFQDVEQVLPLPTRILIFLSNMLKNWWWLYIPGAVFLAVGLKRYINIPKGRRQFDQFLLSLPIIGKIAQQEMVIRFTRTLGILLTNGIAMVTALDMVKKAVGNIIVQEEIQRIYEEIKIGKGLVEPLSKSQVFPVVISDLVAAGQEVGSLESSLLKIADTYENNVGNAIKIATSLMEPIVIVVMGLVVGFIVLAMLLPIFEISGAIK